MNVIVAFNFIDEKGEIIENNENNAVILHIDKAEITPDDQRRFKYDIELFIRGLHDTRERLSCSLFDSHKKVFTHASLKMSAPNNGAVLLRAVQALENYHF